MTTFPPIQPRPILCKTTTTNNNNNNNIQSSSSSSPIYLVQSSAIINSDLNNSSSQIPSLISTPLTPYEEFLKRLRDFHRGRQTTFRCLPTIAGQIVDLHLLYNTVVNHGGWDKVNDRQLWSIIAENFSIDSTCLNGTQALKNIYIRYLYAFEKITNGENIDSRDDENEDSKRRTTSQLQRVPQSYNHTQHNVSESLRNQYGLFNDFVNRTEYEKLELALLCGFPNELTFTLNTLLLLSSSSNHTKSFHLYKCPRLLDLLLRHIGLFSSSDYLIDNQYSFKYLYDNLWSKYLNYHLEEFWIETCSPSILKLILNIDLNQSKIPNNNNIYQNFNLNSNENIQQQEFRIEQILMIIRNLSFDRLNAHYLLDRLRSPTSIIYKFLLLISYCEKKIELQKYAFDIWTNLSLYMHIRLINNNEGLLFRNLLDTILNSYEYEQENDRFKIIRTLEIISNLSHAGNNNGIYLIDYINVMIKYFIHIPDILILVHTLECLYQLSELGEQVCDAILNVQSSISIITTLIHLLTIEARSFSSQTIKTIKIVEMSTGPVLLPSYHQPPPPLQPSQQSVVVIQPTQQQYLRPLTAITGGINSSLINFNEKKRKYDSISETISAVVNGTPSSSSSPPIKHSRLIPAIKKPTTSIENEIIESTISDLVDRCSSSFENEIYLCLNDLCQRVVFIVDKSLTNIYNQLPSPVFKRKIETQISIKNDELKKKSSNRLIRKKSLTEDINEQQELITDVKPINTLDYICEWDNCLRSFSTPRAVFHHVCSNHVKYLSDYICLWNGCDKLRRQKWALISHIQERHCSEMAFRQAKLKLTNPASFPSTTTNTNTVPIPSSNIPISNNRSGTVGYAPDAAWLAIRRHMQIGSFDDQINKTKEGPLTKSIRLTAALILRNIARHSTTGKQNLRQYEQLLANLALESSEASHTLSSCLFELYN